MHDRSSLKALNPLTLSGESCRIHSNQAPKGIEEWSPRVPCPDKIVLLALTLAPKKNQSVRKSFFRLFGNP